MVVVSGSWVKNVATYPAPTSENDAVISTTNNMSAKAVLICRPTSHPFQERTLTLDQPVKVGRSVARARATPTNAIFDCKVLSRHHALLWYENGKFFLQDTKSSNGTFVNNTRLSSSESEPHEVYSGDIVQFGVDVVENNRKVTHGCIVATLKLYLPDGKEAKASPSITESTRQGLIPLDELYRLNQIIQEASQREQCLENKLTTLQQIVEEARKSADESWQAYIGEERLLSRVATLENQLQQAVKNFGDDKLKEELARLQEEKTQYQLTAKETLGKLHSDRLQAIALAAEQERARISAEQEAILIKEQLVQVQQELQDVAQKLTEEKRKMEENRIENEQKRQELQCRLEAEMQTVRELKEKLVQFTAVENPTRDLSIQELERSSLIYRDTTKNKEDILAELENCDNRNTEADNISGSNVKDHIDLMVAPVQENNIDFSIGMDDTSETSTEGKSSGTFIDEEANNKNSFSTQEQLAELPSANFQANGFEMKSEDEGDIENDNVDSRTLKYQLISVQKQMTKRVEELSEQVAFHSARAEKLSTDLKKLQEDHAFLQESFEAKCDKNSTLLNTINDLEKKLASTYEYLRSLESAMDNQSAIAKFDEKEFRSRKSVETLTENHCTFKPQTLSEGIPVASSEMVASLEEELVLLKERYADLVEEKLMLQKKIASVEIQYRDLCNASYNKMFFYIAPLVIMVIYLLFTSMFS